MNMALSGTLPDSVGSLTALWYLYVKVQYLPDSHSTVLSLSAFALVSDFDSNNISGTIPQSMGSMTALEHMCATVLHFCLTPALY